MQTHLLARACFCVFACVSVGYLLIKYILSPQPTYSWLTIDAVWAVAAEYLLWKSAADQPVC